MYQSDKIATFSGDRVQLPLLFDPTRMLEEVDALNLGDFLHYSVLPLRSPAHLVDPSLPLPPPAENYADGSWTEWLDSRALRESPYLLTVVDTFRANCKVTLVRLLRLAPDGVIDEHVDPTLGLQVPNSVVRLTIPILTNDATQFFLNDVPVAMRPGECWYMRLSDPHRVINPGKIERINMTIDMIPNQWLISQMTGQKNK